MIAADRERLARILGMLGSHHDGERASAAAAADRFIRDRGLTWPDVVGQPPPAMTVRPQVEPPPKRMTAESAVWALKHDDGILTEWERSYCRSVAGFRRLSPKQRDVLRRVILKVAAAAA